MKISYNFLKKHKIFIFTILLYLFIRIFFSLFNKFPLWWDAAAYIGIGKFLFSSGQIGVFEPLRPILLPLILGLAWKLNFNLIYFGGFLEIIFTLGITLMVYLLANKLFNKKIADIAAFITAFNFLIFTFSFIIYTEIPATFCILTSLFFSYKFISKRSILSLLLAAFFATAAFLFRYPFGLIFIIINLILVKDLFERKNIYPLFLFNFFSFIFLIPYFVFNYLKFGNFLYLLNYTQNYYAVNLGGSYNIKAFQQIPIFILPKVSYLYLLAIILFFNILLPFLIYGIYKLIKEKYYLKKEIIFYLIIPIIIFYIYFQFFYIKDERYILNIIPFLAIITAYGLFKSKKPIFISLIIYFLFTIILFSVWMPRETAYDKFFQEPPINITCSKVASSDPRTALNYLTAFPYEVYDDNWKPLDTIKNKEVDCIFYYSCSILRQNHVKIINNLNYKTVYYKEWGPKCDYYIFKLEE